MSREDAYAKELILKLVKKYSDRLWVLERGSDEYTQDKQYCSSCYARKYVNDSPVHNDKCEGVKLIIDSLNYANGNSNVD